MSDNGLDTSKESGNKASSREENKFADAHSFSKIREDDDLDSTLNDSGVLDLSLSGELEIRRPRRNSGDSLAASMISEANTEFGERKRTKRRAKSRKTKSTTFHKSIAKNLSRSRSSHRGQLRKSQSTMSTPVKRRGSRTPRYAAQSYSSSPAKKNSPLQDFLASKNLSQYYHIMVFNGYDTLEKVGDVDKEALKSMGITKVIHQRQLLNAINSRKLGLGAAPRSRRRSRADVKSDVDSSMVNMMSKTVLKANRRLQGKVKVEFKDPTDSSRGKAMLRAKQSLRDVMKKESDKKRFNWEFDEEQLATAFRDITEYSTYVTGTIPGRVLSTVARRGIVCQNGNLVEVYDVKSGVKVIGKNLHDRSVVQKVLWDGRTLFVGTKSGSLYGVNSAHSEKAALSHDAAVTCMVAWPRLLNKNGQHERTKSSASQDLLTARTGSPTSNSKRRKMFTRLLTSGKDKTVRVWSVHPTACKPTLRHYMQTDDVVTEIQCYADLGDVAVFYARGGSAPLTSWDITSTTKLVDFQDCSGDYLLTSDKLTMCVGYDKQSHRTHVWDVVTGERVLNIDSSQDVPGSGSNCTSIAMKGDLIYVPGVFPDSVLVYDRRKPDKPVADLDPAASCIRDIRVVGNHVVVSAYGGAVRVWRDTDHELIQSFDTNQYIPTCVSASLGGAFVCCNENESKDIRWWRLKLQS